MTTPSYHVRLKEDRRLQAVMALFRGEQASHVSVTFRISRSDLYKFLRRALTAMRQALADHRRVPKRPHTRVSMGREGKVVGLCQRHPTLSSYQVQERLGQDAPSPRTIQRVRTPNSLPRVANRAPPSAPAHQVSLYATTWAQDTIHEKPHLGPEHIPWDLRNGENLQISPFIVKRLKKKMYDLMYPPPPQTNGQLERAFRDDMEDFYRQYDEWTLESLRRDLPAYVYYRNSVRGHRALGGQSSITRLKEHDRFASQELLDRLESFARYEVKRKVVSRDGYIQMFGHMAYVWRA